MLFLLTVLVAEQATRPTNAGDCGMCCILGFLGLIVWSIISAVIFGPPRQ